MPRTALQIAASRTNGARSRGPVSARGKARSAMNARRHGLRARDATAAADHEVARCRAMANDVRASIRPRGAAEQAVLTRIVRAMWQVDQAARLEQRFWAEGAVGLDPCDPLHLVKIVAAAPATRSLGTIMRYQAAAESALTKALRDLSRLRRAKPLCTNEPERRAAVLHERTRDTQAGAGSFPSDEPDDSSATRTAPAAQPPVCTNEPGNLQPAMPRSAPIRASSRCTNEPEKSAPALGFPRSTNPASPPRTAASAAARPPCNAGSLAKPPDTNDPEQGGAQGVTQPTICMTALDQRRCCRPILSTGE